MAHTSEIRWNDIAQLVSSSSEEGLKVLSNAEELYQDLLEVWTYAGGTDALAAELLFKEEIEARGSGASATQEEIDKVADLKAAMTSLHELYQALNNTAIATEDRAAKLRRMS